MPDHVLADGGLTDVDAELEQFAVNVRRSPKWVLAAQHADQLANLFRHRRAARLAVANLSPPEQSEALALPADDRGGFEDGKLGLPAAQHRGETDPEQAIGRGQLGAFDGALEDADLMAQRQDLQLKRGAGLKRGRLAKILV